MRGVAKQRWGGTILYMAKIENAPESEKSVDSTEIVKRDGVVPGSLRRVSILVALITSLLLVGAGGQVVALGVLLSLILLHEAGHFFVAKVCKMKVEEFFVGFGPPVWSIRKKGIEYGVKSIPLGGYVKITGMTALDKDHPQGYQQASRIRKIAVVAAGPATNFLIALLVGFATLFMVGLPTATQVVDKVDPRLGAAAAGIRPGDKVVAVNGKMIDEWNDVGETIDMLGAETTVDVVIERGGLRYQYPVQILRDAGLLRIGVTAETEYVTLPFKDSAFGSVEAVGSVAYGSLQGVVSLAKGLGGLVSGLFGAEVAPESRPLSPVGAVQIGAEVGGRSLFDAMQLIMVYSTFLAVFNLLPILPLDGGRITVVLYETVASAVRRKKVEVSQAAMTRASTAFTLFLLGVGLIALILDLTQPVLQ